MNIDFTPNVHETGDRATLVRTYGLTYGGGLILGPDLTDWNQIVYAVQGVLRVSTDQGTWVLPPHRGLWLPAGVRSTRESLGKVALRMIYLRTDLRSDEPLPFDGTRCAVLNVSPLLRELILKTINIGALVNENANHRRIADLMIDELQGINALPLQLPYPRNPQSIRFIDALDQTRLADIEGAAFQAGASRRTLERIFRKETGMSLGQWVRRRRLLTGLGHLAKGETISNTAFELGYNGPSAFIAMFKRELGETPNVYLGNTRVP